MAKTVFLEFFGAWCVLSMETRDWNDAFGFEFGIHQIFTLLGRHLLAVLDACQAGSTGIVMTCGTYRLRWRAIAYWPGR